MEQHDRREAGGEDPFAVWREMRERGGARATLIQLYALVAEPRGLKPHELPLAERRELAGRATPLMWPGFEYNERSKPRERQPVRSLPTTKAGRRGSGPGAGAWQSCSA